MTNQAKEKYTVEFKENAVKRADEHLYDELKRLKKEVARLTEERDLLKKAAAYPSLYSGQALPEKHGRLHGCRR